MQVTSVETRTIQVVHAGCVPYTEAWEWQRQLAKARSSGQIEDTLLLLEHPPTITLGRAADQSNLLATPAALAQQGIAVVETNRGGDVTYHAPGQIVGYPILKLSRHGANLLRYLRKLEEVIIQVLADYGLAAGRVEGLTGVWLNAQRPHRADWPAALPTENDLDVKIAAIGVHLSASGVTTHGFALNVRTDLHGFSQIVPCGIRDRGVTSLEQVLDTTPALPAVTSRLLDHFADVFAVEVVTIDRDT
ncbi:MAG: lipoyl(octanoyl) transferase LipB [Chloroflexaceae bacterium]|nr:lipoyl(octanoyl) transferase LipB [Chloroflexaceae bacterium]